MMLGNYVDNEGAKPLVPPGARKSVATDKEGRSSHQSKKGYSSLHAHGDAVSLYTLFSWSHFEQSR